MMRRAGTAPPQFCWSWDHQGQARSACSVVNSASHPISYEPSRTRTCPGAGLAPDA